MDNGFIDITASPFNADPTGATDSTTRIQAAFNTGARGFYGKGSFWVDGQLELQNGQTFAGAGKSGATTLFKREGGWNFNIFVTATEKWGVTVRDMMFDGGTRGASAVSFDRCLNAHILSIEAKNVHGCGIGISKTSDFYVRDCTLNNIGRAIPAGDGVPEGMTRADSQHGISMFDNGKGTISGCHIDGINLAAGINISNSQGVIVSGNYIGGGNHDFGAVRFSNGSHGCSANGNTLIGFYFAVNMDGGKDNAVVGNTCIDQTVAGMIFRAGNAPPGLGLPPRTCEGHVVNANNIINPAGPGIWLNSLDGQPIADMVIVGNSAKNRGAGCQGVIKIVGICPNLIAGWNRGNVPEWAP